MARWLRRLGQFLARCLKSTLRGASPIGPDEERQPPRPSTSGPATVYRDVDLARVAEALQRQMSGVHRAIEAFEKAKEVSQESLDYEVRL
jgi:hypothetical protein